MREEVADMAQRKRPPARGPVWTMSAEEATLACMPKYNAHACGAGPHGRAGYDREREKRAWRTELATERAAERRPSPFRATRGTKRMQGAYNQRKPERKAAPRLKGNRKWSSTS